MRMQGDNGHHFGRQRDCSKVDLAFVLRADNSRSIGHTEIQFQNHAIVPRAMTAFWMAVGFRRGKSVLTETEAKQVGTWIVDTEGCGSIIFSRNN